MEKQEIMEKLCSLSTLVGREIYKSTIPHDCWCRENVATDFMFDEEIIKYIEDAVCEKINKLKEENCTKFCKDCRYCSEPDKTNSEFYKKVGCDFKFTNPVNGSAFFTNCWNARKHEGFCGVKGKRFKKIL